MITIAIRLPYDYDPTTTYRARLLPIRRKQKTNMSIFRRSRIVVESQLWYGLKVLRRAVDMRLYDTEFHTEGSPTLKVFADSLRCIEKEFSYAFN